MTSDPATTGWCRLIGSLNLQVSFGKSDVDGGSLLPKETYKIRDPVLLSHPLGRLHVVAAPYIGPDYFWHIRPK